MCTTLAQGCGSSGMVLAMHHIQVACIARHALASPFFAKYLRGVRREAAAHRLDHVGGRHLGRHALEHLRRRARGRALQARQGRDHRLVRRARRRSLVTCRRNPEAPPSDQVLVLVRKADRTLDADEHLGHAGHARHLQPGLQADVVGARGADAAGLVRRRLGADDGLVLAHPLVGACGSASPPTRSARAAAFVRAEARKKPGHRAADGDAPGRSCRRSCRRLRNNVHGAGARVRRDHGAPDGHGGAAHHRLGAQDEQHQGRVVGDGAADRARRAADHRHRRLQERLEAVGRPPLPRLAVGGADDLQRPHLRARPRRCCSCSRTTERWHIRHRELLRRAGRARADRPGPRAGRVRARRGLRGRARALQRAGHASSPKDDGAEVYTFPPVIDRTIIEKTDYLDSFPHLAGTVFSFFGKDKQAKELSAKVHAGEPWGDTQGMTDVCLNPAACYPVYPVITGTLPRERAPGHDDQLGLPARAVAGADAHAVVPRARVRARRHARHGRRVARHVAAARARPADGARAAGEVGRGLRSVLRPRAARCSPTGRRRRS